MKTKKQHRFVFLEKAMTKEKMDSARERGIIPALKMWLRLKFNPIIVKKPNEEDVFLFKRL